MAKQAVRAKQTKANSAERTAAEDTFALDLVMQLLAIPGRSGEEGAVARFVSERLAAAGAPADALVTDNAHTKTIIKGDVGNLILRLPGTVRGPRRLLMAHMDTVPICFGAKPARKGDVIISTDPTTGLGGDDRAGCGVILNAALKILKEKLPHPPLTFVWMIQEEVGLHGARNLQLNKLGGKIGLAFNWDGGPAEKVTIGATGGYRLAIEITGLASHAGVAPQEGVSAIAIASIAIADLVQNGWHGLIEKGKLTGTSNIGVIRGGDATNVVTDHVTIKAEARSHDAKFRMKIVKEIEQAFTRAVKAVKNTAGKTGQVEFDGRLDYESFKLPTDSPCVVAAQAAVQAIGAEPYLAIANGGLDANWMNEHGIPTVTLGCGQQLIHTVNEQLDLIAYQKACEIALKLAVAG
jgi:tripeptide aminopeptidase